MAFCTVNWFSNSIGKCVQANVILPDVGKPPFATYYLLHGLSDDYSIWQRRTRIEQYVANLPMIVVMPDGYRSFYTTNDQGADYFKYMTEDLPAFIERNFPARKARTARCVGGLSMGGYGALRMALGRPDLYASVNSHSGALLRGSGMHIALDEAEMLRIFGKNPKGTDHDIIHLVRKAQKAGLLPKILIDCGTEDFLLDHNRRYHQELDKLKIEHEYREFPGSHTWDYWDLHVREAIAFHAKNLRLKTA